MRENLPIINSHFVVLLSDEQKKHVNPNVRLIPKYTTCWRCKKFTNQHDTDTCHNCGAEL